MKKALAPVLAALKSAGFETEHRNGVLEITKPGKVNPSEVRSAISALLSSEGFRGYYLKEAYAYQGARTPWRTEEEGFIEFVPWEDGFTRVEEQKKVAGLNKAIISGAKVTPLASEQT